MLVDVLLWVSLLVLLWLTFLKRPSGLPPGRWGLPLVGYVPLTRLSMEQQVMDLRTQYGDIYLWRMGTQVVLFLHDHQLVREAFNRPEFQDRPKWDTFKLRETEMRGIVGSNGPLWQNSRRFTLKQLRDLGMGKSKLVTAMHTQATQLVQEFKKQAGRPAPMPHALHVAIVNIIWQMVGGQQFTLTDPKLEEFEEIVDKLMVSLGRVAISDFLPWLNYILPSFFARRFFRFDVVEFSKDRFLKFFYTEIKEHQATLDWDSPRDLIDGYLMEMEERKDDPNTTFSEKNLAFLILDLFTAGSETTKASLTWMFYYVATNPKVQLKLHAEIDEVLPQGTLPTLLDKSRLPYTDAVIHETLRKSSLAAYGVQHVANQDTTLGGYTIPKGTILASANTSIHHDPYFWDQPDQFLPERWLDQNGKFNTKKEGFMPFSIGKRQCVGEGLARMELFIFSTVVFQSLAFSVPPAKTLSLQPDPGNPFIHIPLPQDLIITVRR